MTSSISSPGLLTARYSDLGNGDGMLKLIEENAEGSGQIPQLPRKKEKRDFPKPAINGLPPTPKVLVRDLICSRSYWKPVVMTPLWSQKVYARINHQLIWDQYIIFGTEEGIYTLNLNELHEATMEQVIFGVLNTQNRYGNIMKEGSLMLEGTDRVPGFAA
ncbi:mitogen-activated protein kinase kinase kinase kinase 5 isoform x3 [Limosa lapponica baueri]|uniref:Mitogen-activated protein kinase kinase kinase kinase 5 isoform x3 n=1 Tax=Limosa lapponica baueri TaxID=1758121 RepID=A0A2I0T8H9_LIMLA|nr:mitogen-activated protein kinase kinase kinase kinase 5 isoform x3 [Limosa lapponica baueri]